MQSSSLRENSCCFGITTCYRPTQSEIALQTPGVFFNTQHTLQSRSADVQRASNFMRKTRMLYSIMHIFLYSKSIPKL